LTTDAIAARPSEANRLRRLRVAVLVPCYNEEAANADMVRAFRAELPDAVVYVYDNNSTGRTMDVARAAGALVRRKTHQGRGFVVRRMFDTVARGRREIKLLAYLRYGALGEPAREQERICAKSCGPMTSC